MLLHKMQADGWHYGYQFSPNYDTESGKSCRFFKGDCMLVTKSAGKPFFCDSGRKNSNANEANWANAANNPPGIHVIRPFGTFVLKNCCFVKVLGKIAPCQVWK
jgi:hypothetical protein